MATKIKNELNDDNLQVPTRERNASYNAPSTGSLTYTARQSVTHLPTLHKHTKGSVSNFCLFVSFNNEQQQTNKQTNKQT